MCTRKPRRPARTPSGRTPPFPTPHPTPTGPGRRPPRGARRGAADEDGPGPSPPHGLFQPKIPPPNRALTPLAVRYFAPKVPSGEGGKGPAEGSCSIDPGPRPRRVLRPLGPSALRAPRPEALRPFGPPGDGSVSRARTTQWGTNLQVSPQTRPRLPLGPGGREGEAWAPQREQDLNLWRHRLFAFQMRRLKPLSHLSRHPPLAPRAPRVPRAPRAPKGPQGSQGPKGPKEG